MDVYSGQTTAVVTQLSSVQTPLVPTTRETVLGVIPRVITQESGG